MKTMIFGALALALAVPAAAQTAPAADPHAGHPQPAKGHEGHKMDCKECCEKMKQHHGKMDHQKQGEKKPASADHEAHSAH